MDESFHLVQNNAHLLSVFVEQDARRDTEYEQYDQFAQGDKAACDQKTDEAEAGVCEEDRDLQTDDDTVEDRGHQQSWEGNVLDADIAQQIHGDRGKQACERAEDHIVEAQTRCDGADVRDNAAEGQARDCCGGVNRQYAQYFCDTELNRCGGSAGQEGVLTDGEHGVERGDDRRLRDVHHTFVFHILLSP